MLARYSNDRLNPGDGALDDSLRAELELVRDQLRNDVRPALQDMLKALDGPQASGRRWYD